MSLISDLYSYLLPNQDVSGQLHFWQGTLADGLEELVIANRGLLLSRDERKSCIILDLLQDLKARFPLSL